jgi:hypothetical protein
MTNDEELMSKETPNFLTCPGVPEISASSSVSSGLEPKRPRKWFLYKKSIAIMVIVVIVILLIPVSISVFRTASAASSAKKSIQNAQTHITNLDVESAKNDIDSARDSLGDIHDILQSIGFWRDLPGIGIQIRAIEDAAAAGSGTLDGTRDLLEIASVVLDALRGGSEATSRITTGIAPTRKFDELSKEEKQDLLRKFHDELPRLRLARDKLELALELWNRVPQDKLASPLRNTLKPLADALPIMKHALDEAVPIIEVIVPMSGYPEPRRYLISLQNDDEIRPAGGFIGTIGTMTWDAGELSEFLFTDVYNIDNPVSGIWKEIPPDPLRQYLGVQNWFLRDANWSPDFPTSADRILDFYVREAELQLHAQLPNRPTTYLALEPGFFESILNLTGPLTVDGKTYDSKNFFEQLEFEVEVAFHQKGIQTEKRKEIITKLGDELKKKIFALPASRWPEVLDIVTKALERKQIMAYSRDKDLQAVFDSRGWAARAKATDGDFLWVVDANLAALKTDGAMKKDMTYAFDANNPDGPTATVTLKYTNTAKGFGDYRYTRYRTYTRVYVPEGSVLLSSKGAMKDDLNKTGGKLITGTVDVFKDLGKSVFGAFWSIEPNTIGELSFTYRLPPNTYNLTPNTYHLDWPKQPGVDNASLTLDLSFDKNIKSVSPPEQESKWGDARYEYNTDSLTDRTFKITF